MIACDGDNADYVLLIVSGVARSCKIFQNGERTVIAFYLPGDMFGWGDKICPLSIEAASDAIVVLIKRHGLATLAATNTQLAKFLRLIVTKELKRAQEHAATLSISAKDRFLTFLKDWLKRAGVSGCVRIPVGHQHVADHLGIKIETLSPVITELEQLGALSRSSSRGTLILRRQLSAL